MPDIKPTDYPAAHSMDSGWFAIDEDGNVAHFDPGEAGALPTHVRYMTGEVGAGEEDDLWFTLVMPWIARNYDPPKIMDFGLLYALFETEEHATQAADAGQQTPGDASTRIIRFLSRFHGVAMPTTMSPAGS